MTEGASWLELAVNYKHPGEDVSVAPERYAVGYADYSETLSEDAKFLVCVIETCMLIHGSEYLSEAVTPETILGALNALSLADFPARAEFADLLQRLWNATGA